MLEIRPSFVVVIVVCVVFGPLRVWVQGSGDEGRGFCVASLHALNYLSVSFQRRIAKLSKVKAELRHAQQTTANHQESYQTTLL